MKKIVSHLVLPMLALFCATSGTSIAENSSKAAETGTLETLIVASGDVSLDLDLNRLNGVAGKASKLETVRFQALNDSFLPFLVLNNELRGAKPGVIALVTTDAPSLPAQLREALHQLVLEKGDSEQPYEFVVRDGKTGFVYFNIEGQQYHYDAQAKSLRITDGRLLISEGFAKNIGRPADAGVGVGNISVAASLRAIEVEKIVNGEVKSGVLPAAGTVPGPDVIVGDITAVAQGGSSGSFVGLGVGTTSCNNGVVDLNWFQIPNTDHPVIPQNLYRMSGGTGNTERFEQIGQSWLKHAFTALTQNICNLGCNGVGGPHLGSGCSDPYDASLNYSQSGLGSRAWVNPFTGAYPSTARDHSGHTHTGTSHRVMVAVSDLSTTANPGATYFAEGQYVTPHEYAWCGANPGQCNMYNNVSYRQFTVTGTASPFSFASAGTTQRSKPAINAWTGATLNPIEPAPGVDGTGVVGYKVSNPSAGVWHYEYAVYNSTLDRAIQSFSVPLGCGVTASNIGFHAPPNEAGSANDGSTPSGTGFSNAAWATTQTLNALTWNSETFAQNANANALRWGTIFNFRFDSNRPPMATTATVGFYKTGAPIMVAIQAPTPDVCAPLSFASAVSRKTHGAGGPTFDINLPLSGQPGVECRTGGANGDHTIVLTFSNNLVSGNAAVTAGVGATTGSPTFSGNTMTVNLTGVTDIQQVTVTLSNVTDVFAQTMPNTPVSMNVLLGDTNGNKTVNGSDVAQTKASSGATLDATNFRADVNISGGTNGSDVAQVKANAGHTVP